VNTEAPDIETSSEEYARRFSGRIGEYFLDVQANITLGLLRSFSEASVLDIGGGHAQLAVPLVRNGFKVTVAGSADVCRKRLDMLLAPGSYEYHTCDLLKLPFKDNQFDVVIAFRLLPHVDQWQELIAEMCRVSQKIIVVDYPDIRSFNILYKLLFHAKKAYEANTRAFRSFARKEVVREFNKHEFGKPVFKPEFLSPMVVHRVIQLESISRTVEWIGRMLGLTYLFGSPIILRVSTL